MNIQYFANIYKFGCRHVSNYECRNMNVNMGGCTPHWSYFNSIALFSWSIVIPSSVFGIALDMAQKQPYRVFLGKDVLKICSKFTGEHSFALQLSWNTHRHGCSPANLLHILRTPFHKNTSGGLLLMAPIIRQHMSLWEIYADSSPSIDYIIDKTILTDWT